MRLTIHSILFTLFIVCPIIQTSAFCDGGLEPKPKSTIKQEPLSAREKIQKVVSKKMKEIDRPKSTAVPPVGSQKEPKNQNKMEADLSELIEKSEEQASRPMVSPSNRSHQINDTVYVVPEQKTFVDFSKTDVNRLHCEGDREMSGAVFSEDKGLVINRSGSNAFLRVVPDSYAFQNPFELFVMCSSGTSNTSLYRIIGTPVLELSKNVILKNDGEKMNEAINFFKGRTREQSIVEVIKKTFEENWDSNWTITPRFKKIADKPEYSVTWYRSVDTNAEWVAEIYAIEAKARSVTIPEDAFVNPRTVAVSIFDPVVENGKLGQVVVIREKVGSL